MAIIKCKMCGGDIELSSDKTFGTCEFCGSTMTLPKVDDEQRATAFNRGNYFRRIGEFDKALAVYEHIVQEDNTDAEAHWCCALCRFGIEYVEDPNTYEWLPTCHRLSFDNFLEDVDYLAAVEHSDGITRRQYQKDAVKIAEVQRGILATSRNAEPFDVFICYKESDENGERTRDSALAQDIYYQLTEQGHRVFFARITLEDVAGSEYEPYIFAALNSAKVMVVVGTRPEHLNAVWVKNEWSRFLTLMKKDRSKLLLPCYRDMDPYDMPEQLSVLQSYDMAKIGFIQDLTRGIAKVLDVDREVIQESATSGNAGALLERGMMALEDDDWQKADGFFEEVLNQNAKCAEAYVGKALAEAKCRNLEAFIRSRLASSSSATEKTIEIPADTEHIEIAVEKYVVPGYFTKNEVEELYKYDLTYSSAVQTRKQQKCDEEAYWKNHKQLSRACQFAIGNYKKVFEDAYQSLMRVMDEHIANAEQQEKENEAALRTRYVSFLKEADKKVAKMSADAQAKREDNYQEACKSQEYAFSESDFCVVLEQLRKLNGYKDSDTRIATCQAKVEQLRQEAKQLRQEADAQLAKREKKKKIICLGCIAFAIIIASVCMFFQWQQARKQAKEQAEFQRLMEERKPEIQNNLIGKVLSFSASITSSTADDSAINYMFEITFLDKNNCHISGTYYLEYMSGTLKGHTYDRDISEDATYSLSFMDDGRVRLCVDRKSYHYYAFLVLISDNNPTGLTDCEIKEY